jgi:hypothetical protein
MSSHTRNKLRTLALLGVITGAGLGMEGRALAAPTLRACADTPANDRFNSQCDYEVHPLQMPTFDIAPPKKPDPIPPYSS